MGVAFGGAAVFGACRLRSTIQLDDLYNRCFSDIFDARYAAVGNLEMRAIRFRALES